MLWRCWLGGRKCIQPVKTEWWGAGMVICLEQGADLHMAQLMPLPLTVSCFSKIQINFTFLVPAHPGSPGKRAVKRVCVCVSTLKLWVTMNIHKNSRDANTVYYIILTKPQLPTVTVSTYQQYGCCHSQDIATRTASTSLQH